MNSLDTIARLAIAVAAASVTFALFATIVSLGEPDRSALIAHAEAKRLLQATASAPILLSQSH
jgi:hypothetical protein